MSMEESIEYVHATLQVPMPLSIIEQLNKTNVQTSWKSRPKKVKSKFVTVLKINLKREASGYKNYDGQNS